MENMRRKKLRHVLPRENVAAGGCLMGAELFVAIFGECFKKCIGIEATFFEACFFACKRGGVTAQCAQKLRPEPDAAGQEIDEECRRDDAERPGLVHLGQIVERRCHRKPGQRRDEDHRETDR